MVSGARFFDHEPEKYRPVIAAASSADGAGAVSVSAGNLSACCLHRQAGVIDSRTLHQSAIALFHRYALYAVYYFDRIGACLSVFAGSIGFDGAE